MATVENIDKKLEMMNRVRSDGHTLNLDRTHPTVKSLTVEETLTVNAGGTLAIGLGVPVTRALQERQIQTRAKVGTTAGWVVGAADNLPYMATLPASQSASTLVVPIDGLKIGDIITAFKVVAQIESAGGAVTLDADLRKITNVAAEPTDASVGAITQVSVTADTAVEAEKTGLADAAGSHEVFYLLITATTAASTDIILLGAIVTVTEQ